MRARIYELYFSMLVVLRNWRLQGNQLKLCMYVAWIGTLRGAYVYAYIMTGERALTTNSSEQQIILVLEFYNI